MSEDGSLFGGLWPPPARLPDPQPYQSTRCPLIVNQRTAEAIREALGDQAPDMLISEPIPSRPTIKQMSELLAAVPRMPRRTLHCHPAVTITLLAEAPPKPEPSFMDLGRIGDLCGIDVYEDPDMLPGYWEIREDGKTFNFGVLRSAT